MTPLVSILTPSLKERRPMLRECQASVKAQTRDVWEHLIQVDEQRLGCAITTNRLAKRAVAEWLLPLADDDLLLPGCLDSLLERAGEADIVYSPPLVTGNEDRWWFYQAPPVIPSTALIRASLWREIGGYDESVTREEDRGFWVKALDRGAIFVRVDDPCWIYRQHSGNKSMLVAA